jgi:hypothetical protein
VTLLAIQEVLLPSFVILHNLSSRIVRRGDREHEGNANRDLVCEVVRALLRVQGAAVRHLDALEAACKQAGQLEVRLDEGFQALLQPWFGVETMSLTGHLPSSLISLKHGKIALSTPPAIERKTCQRLLRYSFGPHV